MRSSPSMTTKTANLWATPSARMPQCSRLLPSVEGSWCHSLKPHGRRCIPSPLRSRCDLLHLPFPRLALLARLLLSQQLPSPRFSPKFNQSQNLRRLFSLSIQVVKPSKSGFLTRSRTPSSMKPRFLRAMTYRQMRTFPMLQCCSLQDISSSHIYVRFLRRWWQFTFLWLGQEG